jgi:hypothetical protein
VITLSKKWASSLILLPETGMGYQLVTVYLRDGRRFDRVTVVGGQITSIGSDPSIPFEESDMEKIVATP